MARKHKKLAVNVTELEKYVEESTDAAELKRLLIVFLCVQHDMPPEKISKILLVSTSWVRQVLSSCNTKGLTSLLRQKAGGRFRENLTFEQEKRLIANVIGNNPEEKKLDAKKLRKIMETELGRSVAKSTVYRVLKNHGWMKITRPTHYKSNTDTKIPIDRTTERLKRKRVLRDAKEKKESSKKRAKEFYSKFKINKP